MSVRSEALASKVEALVADATTAVRGASEAQWRAICAGETWSVGVTGNHFANGHLGGGVQFVQAVASGQGAPPVTMEMINQMNAEAASASASCTKQEVLAALAANGANAANVIRAMSDQELDRSASVAAAGGAVLSAEQLIGAAILQSGGEHLASIKAAMG